VKRYLKVTQSRRLFFLEFIWSSEYGVQSSANLVLYFLIMESALNSVSWRVALSRLSKSSGMDGSPKNLVSFVFGKSAQDMTQKTIAITRYSFLILIHINIVKKYNKSLNR